MPASRSRHLIGVVGAVVVLGGLFVGLVFGVRAIDGLGFEPPAHASTEGASITLSAWPDSHPVTATAPAPRAGGPTRTG